MVQGRTLLGGIGVLALGVLGFAPSAALALPNSDPVNTVPGAQVVDEDTNLVFSTANGNLISIADADAGTDAVEVTLTGFNGTINLGSTSGLTGLIGNGSSGVSFQATVTQANTALSGARYRGTSNFSGAGSLTIETDDLGHNGDDGPKSDTDVVPITVNSVNDPPVNAIWANGVEPIVNEDDSIALSGGNTISVSDADALAGDDLRVQLTASNGRLSLTNLGGLSFVDGDGTDDATVTFEGTLTELNASLAGMTYEPNADFTGPDTFKIVTDDLGHNGGAAKTDTDTRSILVRAINRLPGGMGTYKDVPLLIAPANGNDISIQDQQHNSDTNLHLALAVTHGTLTLVTTSNSTVAGNGTAAVTLDGTRSQINSDLGGGITFTPTSGFTGTAAISVTTDDLNLPADRIDDADTNEIRVDAPEDSVYFAGSKNTNAQIPAVIGRADLDGGGGANLVGGVETGDNPSAIAIDVVGERIYWSMTSTSSPFAPTIWSAKLDGTDKQLFISGSAPPPNTKMSGTPGGLIIDQATRRIYWTSTDTVPAFDPAQKVISYASLDDPTAAGGTISTGATATTGGPRTMAFDRDGGTFYWGDTGGNAIGFSPAPGGAGTASKFTVTGVDVTSPLGIAFNPATNRLYWANNSGSTETTRVKYAELSGSTSITGQVFSMGVSTGGGLRSMALDPAAGRLYWGNSSGSGKIEYAALDSSGADSGAMSLDDANHNNLDGVTLLKDPEPVSAPSVSGTSQVGSELSCSDATWASDLLSGSLYRMPKTTGFGGWTKDGNPIAGANSATFTPTETGSYRCMRTATNFAGTSTQTSAPVAVTQPEPPTDPPTETPTDPPTEIPAEPPANPPAGDFTFGKPKLDTKHGTAKLPVDLPGAGEVELAKTKNVKAHDKRAGAAGTVKLLIKPRGDAADKLAKRGSVKVTAKVTFTPDGGTANTESTKVKLKLGD